MVEIIAVHKGNLPKKKCGFFPHLLDSPTPPPKVWKISRNFAVKKGQKQAKVPKNTPFSTLLKKFGFGPDPHRTFYLFLKASLKFVLYQDYSGYPGGQQDNYTGHLEQPGAGFNETSERFVDQGYNTDHGAKQTSERFIDQGYNTDHGFPPSTSALPGDNLGSQAGTPAGLVNSNHRYVKSV